MSRTPGMVDPKINDLLPWWITIDVFQTPISHVNWNNIAANASSIYNAFANSSGAQNDERNHDTVLSQGLWTFEWMQVKATNSGIVQVDIDGTVLGTFDGYASANVYNVRTSFAGHAVAAPGKARIKLKMTSKNASSSAYVCHLQNIALRRTA